MFGVENSSYDEMEEGFEIFTKPEYNNNQYLFNDYLIKPRHPFSHNDIGNQDTQNWFIPSSIWINLETKIVKADGTPFNKTTDKLSLQDIVCHSLFQQIETKINRIPVSDHSRLYQFRAIVHCLYSFQMDYKNIVRVGGFLLDQLRN